MRRHKGKHYLRVEFSGYGHYKVYTEHYGKDINCVTTNMSNIDDYKSEEEKRYNRGYKALRKECIHKNQLT